jgi:hypothetical protein
MGTLKLVSTDNTRLNPGRFIGLALMACLEESPKRGREIKKKRNTKFFILAFDKKNAGRSMNFIGPLSAIHALPRPKVDM